MNRLPSCVSLQGNKDLLSTKGNPKNIRRLSRPMSRRYCFCQSTKRLRDSVFIRLFFSRRRDQSRTLMAIRRMDSPFHRFLISGGNADAALGIQSAANHLHLDFIPVIKEQFDLVFAGQTKIKKPYNI